MTNETAPNRHSGRSVADPFQPGVKTDEIGWMKSRRFRFELLAVLMGLGAAACSNSQPNTSAPINPPPQIAAAPSGVPANAPIAGVAAESVLTVHGKIVSVDTANNLVTLEGPNGKTVTLTVNNPINLASMKAGDRFVARFTEVITIVGKGPSDAPPVATLREGLWTAAPGGPPGALVAAQVRVTVVVTQIDLNDQRVTLQAPDFSTETVHVTNQEALNSLQIGDRIVITVTRAIAIKLVPETAANPASPANPG
jgi:hypothetical protein